MILNCCNFETAKQSLVAIFNVSEEKLFQTLKNSSPFDHRSLPPEEALYEYVCDSIGEPIIDFTVMWFHGTRVENKDLFQEHGVLPKAQARKFIAPRLREMAEGLIRDGENPFDVSLSGKDGPHDEGPFAFLIREVAIQAPAPCHNYLDAPEMVEDIAGILLGQNYEQLVDRFKSVTSPCIVSFWADSKGYELAHALLYVKLVVDGELDLEAAAAANTFFDSEGIIVGPERIFNVEIIGIA